MHLKTNIYGTNEIAHPYAAATRNKSNTPHPIFPSQGRLSPAVSMTGSMSSFSYSLPNPMWGWVILALMLVKSVTVSSLPLLEKRQSWWSLTNDGQDIDFSRFFFPCKAICRCIEFGSWIDSSLELIVTCPPFQRSKEITGEKRVL